MFATGSTLKNRKLKNIEGGIKQVKKIYLKCGFKTILIHANSEFEPLRTEMDDPEISLNCASKKEHVPDI